MDNFYAMIMAGGGGTRLWPLSRRKTPKQMLHLVSQDSMFRMSVTRLMAIFPIERIFVVTGHAHLDNLKQDLPELPPENFILEPYGQDSGPAAGLGLAHIAKINPEAVVAVLTADHNISKLTAFWDVLRAANELAKREYIVTLGIQPTYPATGFGYIQTGAALESVNNIPVYESAGFKEKPDKATAQQFLESGLYCWNSGMFILPAKLGLAEFKRQQSKIYDNLTLIQEDFGTPQYQDTIERVWPQMPKLSIDYAIMEHAERMAMIPTDIGWSDIGSWAALYEELASDIAANVSLGRGEHLNLETTGTLIHSDRTVVTIGLEDLVVVDTPDVIMVCRRDRAQDVRQVVKHLTEKGRDSLL